MNHESSDDLSEFDYPPRVFFTANQMENAEFCEMELGLVGLNKKVCFKVPLYVKTISTDGKKQQSEHYNYYYFT